MDSENSRLKHAREAARFTLQQLAAKIGYSVGTISGIENGHDRPSKRLRKLLVEALSINPEWLATGEGEMFANLHWNDDVLSRLPQQEREKVVFDGVVGKPMRATVKTIKTVDVERGIIEFRPHYRHPELENTFPKTVQLTRPPHQKITQLFSLLKTYQDIGIVIGACLSEELNATKFLEMVSPASIWAIEEPVFRLLFGESDGPAILRELRGVEWDDTLKTYLREPAQRS